MSEPMCKASVCPCVQPCPLKFAMDILGGKWKIPILCALRKDGPARYNELKRKIDGITNTMLASSLKELEGAGLVSRRQYQEMPVRVEYALTQNCDALFPAFQIIAGWSLDMLASQKQQGR